MVENDPFLDAAMRGWINNTAQENLWRVASWYSLEDLIQDGYVKYYQCREKYKFLTNLRHPGDEDKRWFMSLVQRAFMNHIINLANKRTDGPEIALSQIMDDDASPEALSAMLPALPEEQTLISLLNSAPQELISLVELLSKEGKDVVAYLRSRLRLTKTEDGQTRVRRGSKRLRETTNEHYCRRLGLDPSVTNLRAAIAEHLGLADE